MISAILLAAGLSKRMGRPKMILPWGKTTVVGQVLATLMGSGANEILVVTGAAREAVESAVSQAILDWNPGIPVGMVFNPGYANGEMTVSLQVGLAALGEESAAALVVLGDQPQIQAESVQAVLLAYQENHPPLVVPSYQMRRGHPWVIDRSLWAEVLALKPPQTLREFLNRHAGQIQYVPVDSATILQDMDTPQDYWDHRPQTPG